MKAWLQRHHIWHTWGKWALATGTRTPQIEGLPMSSLAYEVVIQERQCSVCGKIEIEIL